MAKQIIRDLAAGEDVNAPFVVRSVRLVPFRNKPGKYLDLLLADRTGEMAGRMWEGAEEAAEGLSPGDLVYMKGRVDEYRGVLQIVVGQMQVCEADEYDLADFVPCSERSREEMIDELLTVIEEIENPPLHALLEEIFGDAEFLERFAICPGAARLHHAYLSGLLEHTLSVVSLCQQAATRHPQLNRDLLLTAALLHDLGKVFELTATTHFDYTEEGRFCGHIVLTDRYVVGKITQVPDFPPKLRNLLTHIILSHHGELEYGAPVKPKVAEALALHFADNLDAKVQIFEDYRKSVDVGPGEWSDYHRILEARLYLGATEEEPEEENSPESEKGEHFSS